MEGSLYARRLREGDGEAVSAMLEATQQKKSFVSRFSSLSVAQHAAAGVYSSVVCAGGDGGRVVALLVLSHAPPRSPELLDAAGDADLSGASWPAWAASAFPSVRAPSSLWVTAFAADPLVEAEAVHCALRAAFSDLPDVDAVLRLGRAGAPAPPLFEGVPRAAKEERQRQDGYSDDEDDDDDDDEEEDTLAVYSCPRDSVIAALRVRDARVEDHDDLVPLFERQSEVLAETFGEFFLAELIAAQSETSRAVVAEANGRAVGFVSATSEVDTEVLRRCFELDEYDGAPGAFAVTLFCLAEEYESRSADFLRPLFDLFPGREYCLVTLPHTAPEPLFLSHFSFARPRPANTFSHVLYLLNRATLDAGASLRVRAAAAGGGDAAELAGLLEGVDGQEGTLRDAADPALRTLVVECEGQAVGVAVLREAAPARELAQHGAVEEVFSEALHPPARQAELLRLALNPIFERRARFVFGECMRELGATVLHYRARRGAALLPLAAREFVQVRPRMGGRTHQCAAGDDHPHAEQDDDASTTKGDGTEEGNDAVFGHFALPLPLVSRPKRVLNARVVVVGASDTGRAALEGLLLGRPDLHLANVTLVSPGGLSRGTAAERQFLPLAVGYDDDGGARLGRLALAARARVVPAAVAGFSAERRVVQLEDGYLVPYDCLLLCPGLQDQAACDLAEDGAGGAPRGLFSVAAGGALAGLPDELAGMPAGSLAVVYGASLGALTAVRGLVRSGVPPDSVLWVSPATRDDARWCGGDQELHERVMVAALERLGVQAVHGLVLERVRQAGGHVTGATLRVRGAATAAAAPPHFRLQPVAGDRGAFSVECAVVLSAGERDVGRPLFRAVQANSLVYDGRLVVDDRFRTARDGVFAAGSVAKFSRRHGGARHDRMSPAALGRALAESVVRELEGADDAGHEWRSPVPALLAAGRPVLATLPGEDTYFSAASAAPRLPLPEKARVLSSSRGDSLSRVVLDGRGAVHAVSFLGHHAVAPRNLASLVGRPWTLLGTLLERYDRGELGDLTRNLAEPWAHALFEDNFGELLEGARDAVEGDEGSAQLLEHVRGLADKGQLDREAVAAAAEHLPDSARASAQRLTLRYLRHNAARLPVYARKPIQQ